MRDDKPQKTLYDVNPDSCNDGYFCLAIAIVHGCTPEKARALYYNKPHWITPDIIWEMRKLHEKYSISALAEMYGLDRSMVVQYLRKTKDKEMPSDIKELFAS